MKIILNLVYFLFLFLEYLDIRSDIDIYFMGLLNFLIGLFFVDNFISDIDVFYVRWF